MEVLQLVNQFWEVISAILALIVWLVRLEGKHKHHVQNFLDYKDSTAKEFIRLEKQLDSLEIKHEQLDTKLVQQLSDVRESLARIEGALGVERGRRCLTD